MATGQPVEFSVLDLAAVREGKSIADTFANSLATAQYTEQLGYKRYWLAEHHNMESIASAATSVLIGYIANGTQTIRVGSGGIMLPNHSPLVIAEQFGTLDALYPGRIDLGLGRAPGTDQVTAAALRRDRFAANDFPDQVNELLGYFSADNKKASVRAIPGEGANVPVWILGSSTDSAYLAAAMGLPYAFASHFAPAYLMDALSIYRKQFKPSAFLQQPYSMAAVNVIAADTTAQASYAATSFLQLAVGFVRGFPKPLPQPVASMDDLWTPAEAAAVQQMRHYSFTGDKETVKQQLTGFLKATQVNELMIVTNTYDPDVKKRSFEIVAEIKEEINLG
ncbi:LLM class flavin-dependent oxidoreductase [Foetidibacter luteolus]|uniref:LLM class flavin-dependent oxidoreductase n=1 Tax=Foetidibacter luteolus TaxID=2608880 RepID=UPI00129C0E7D|nr:LLM class flavin-dependent oxidoreductase [Foetidibacter luteolus]